MSDKKIAGDIDKIAGWTVEEIDQLELTFLHKMFECRDAEGVDATVFYAKYMSKVKLDADNYPIFLMLIQFENHWVVDALLGNNNPETFFRAVQPNTFILSECFKMFTRWKPGSIYPKSLLLLFGLLKLAYENPHEGYRMYPVSTSDVNNLGKHLDEGQDQAYPVNRTILELLDRIAALNDPGGLAAKDEKMMEAAIQANNIRGKFLDMNKHLNEAIPDNLLKRGDYQKNEVAPSGSAAK
jgi:hypothetical protein